ncbi:hypothetical protein HYT84_02745 [Candidatus Micrarchaeota archaeon]|nr:hypothetical protein [Candidatus Micrarchaeota archaeon]
MGNKRRGRERLSSCESCGRTIPRDKAIAFSKRSMFSTDLKGAGVENVSTFVERNVVYCISCAKHRGIFEKKKQMAQRKRGVF